MLGLWHLAWVTCVFVGWARTILDFVLRLHFIHVDFDMAPFEFGTAAALVVLTFAIGFLFGSVFAVVWNWLAAPAAQASASPAQP